MSHRPSSRPQPSDRGATLIEYALIVALVSAVCLTGVSLLGSRSAGKLDGVSLAAHSDEPDEGTTEEPPADQPPDDEPVPAVPTDEGDASQAAAAITTPGGGFSNLDSWNAKNRKGLWTASTMYANEWGRPSYLTIVVTRWWGNGKTSEEIIDGFEVPADGSATLNYGGNDVKDNGSTSDDVVSVSFRVSEVRTTDLAGKTHTFSVSGPSTTAVVPPLK